MFSGGRLPFKLLFVKPIILREERLKILEGIVPVRSLSVSDSTSSFARLPSSCGISLENVSTYN